MGLFDTWKASGITTDLARASQPYWLLGASIDSPNTFLAITEPEFKATVFNSASEYFDAAEALQSFIEGNQSCKEEATKCLVIYVAVLHGIEAREWDWKLIRSHSQGLYTELTESRSNFQRQWLPNIEDSIARVSNFINLVVEDEDDDD